MQMSQLLKFYIYIYVGTHENVYKDFFFSRSVAFETITAIPFFEQKDNRSATASSFAFVVYFERI